jgi:uncharacterized protein (DUF1499 family)
MNSRAQLYARIAVWAGTIVALAALVTAFAAGAGYDAGLWDIHAGFRILQWSVYIAAGSGVAAFAGLVVALLDRHYRAALIGAVGLAVALALVLPSWQLQERAQMLPSIHDITTDTDNPPQFVALRAVREQSPNGPEYGGEKIAQQQKAGYPDIQPLVLDDPPARAFERALAAARNMGWEIAAASPEDGRIEATATTRWFRFKDDVVIRVTPSATGSRIDVRSKSRLGRSDLGTNAKRIRAYFAALNSVS